MPLEVLDIINPGLDLSGTATGRLDYAWQGNRSGRLDLKIRGLSRAGLVLAEDPEESLDPPDPGAVHHARPLA